jgi:hemoglobin
MNDEDMPNESRALYDRLGGEQSIAAVVEDFYRYVLADPLLLPFFEGIAFDRLRRMQREFFAAALGGPIRYTGRPLNAVHAGLGIRSHHLARFLEHLMKTLADRDISESDRYDIYSRIHLYADEITGANSLDG